MPENIIIDFIANTDGLQPAEERLAALGKIDQQSASVFKATTAELNNRVKTLKAISDGATSVTVSATKEQAVYNKLISSLKSLSGQSKTTVQDLLKLNPKGVSGGFDIAGVSVDDFITVLKGASASSTQLKESSSGLRAELISLTKQIAQLKLNGEDTGKGFQDLVQRAGEIRSSLQQAGKAVNAFANEERGIGNLVGSVRALGGAFETSQAAIALFGGENKNLEEVLIRVNGTMALLAGLQEIQQALSKEGAISVGLLVAQEKLATLQTTLLTAAESENVIVSGLATIGIRALNAAMAANPIGLLITAIVAVVGIFAFFISRAHDAAVAQGELNQAIKNGTEGLDAYIAGSKRGLDQVISDLEKAGARQSEIQAKGGLASADVINKRKEQIEELNKFIIKNEGTTNKETFEAKAKAEDLKFKLEQQNADDTAQLHIKQNAYERQLIEENLQDRVEASKKAFAVAEEGSRAQLAAQVAIIKAQAALDTKDAGQDPAKVAAIQAQAAKDVFETQVAFQRRIADLRTKDVELQIENAKTIDATNAELYALELKRITAQAAADVLNTKLSAAEKKDIQTKADADRAAATKAFNEEDRRRAIQAEVDKNSAALTQRNITNEDSLALQEENITLLAQIEIDATKNNSEKVKLLYAQRDQALKDARLAFLKKQLEQELQLEATLFGGNERKRQNSRQLTAIQEEFNIGTISAQNYTKEYNRLIDEQVKDELNGTAKKIDSLNLQFSSGLISFKQYTSDYAQLVDENAAIFEDGEEKKRQSLRVTTAQAKQRNAEIQSYIVQQAGVLGNILIDAFQNQLDEQSQRLDAEKAKIQDLQTQGKISQQESIDRIKKIDAEERRLKYQQAVKDKQAAIFNAAISTAQAVIKAYATVGPLGGPVFAAIAAAIGAAEIAVIASRPIPSYFTGKKDKYTGFARVGEAGAELIEQGGKMRVVKKQEIVWLNAQDKVYTPAETHRLLDQRPVMRKQIQSAGNTARQSAFDYDKLGEAVGKHLKTSVYVNGVLAQEIEKQELTYYRQNRRKF